MHKRLLLWVFFILAAPIVEAQKEKKKSKQERELADLMSQINMDSSTFLKSVSDAACRCIDSVRKAESDQPKRLEGITACISNQVNAYQMSIKLLDALKNPSKDKTITIGGENSKEYQQRYFEIERRLKDSCAAMNAMIQTNDVISHEKSMSKNLGALAAYDQGVEFLKQEDYGGAIPWFQKAVKEDPEFAFAWDNLAVCYRRTSQFDKAEAAYKTSLKIDPKGKTALQNLPVVYQMQKRDDEAIAAYNKFLKVYPGDPEVYYGLAVLYYNNKKDMENALGNMCKAYNIYIEQKNPFRSDAEKVINMIYQQMKKDKKEEEFKRILKANNISF